MSITNVTLNPASVAAPCGLIAKYHFTDTFKLFNGTEQIAIDDSDIALYIDKNSKFKNTNSKSKQYLNFEDQHLMNWYLPTVQPSFIKLYGKINGVLKKGENYILKVTKNWNYDFGVTKSIVITTTSFFGDSDESLGWIFVIGAILAYLSMIAFIVQLKY